MLPNIAAIITVRAVRWTSRPGGRKLRTEIHALRGDVTAGDDKLRVEM